MVRGRDRELRSIGAFVSGLDPTTLLVSGLSGIGKSVTVLAALCRPGAQVPAVRVVRSCSSRPYVQGTAARERLDLSRWTAPAESGPGHEIDVSALLDAAESAVAGSGVAGSGPRVLFVDDLDVLSPARFAWLQRLGDLAYERDWRMIAASRHVPEGVLPDDVELLDLGPLDEGSLRHVLDDAAGTPLATDIAGRVHRWGSGNPRIALELADGLSPAQRRGDAYWAGPDTVGPVARRAYRVLLDAPGGEWAAARHPLLALLRREQATSVSDGDGRLDLPAPVAPVAPTAETILDGLHLESVSELPAAECPSRAAARAVGVALLSGAAWVDGGACRWMPTGVGPEWTDHLWWRDAGSVESASSDTGASAAGVRVAAALLALERTGQVTDPAGLRADLDVLAGTPDLDLMGVCLLVRARLLLGDGPGARRLLDGRPGAAAPRTAAETVALDVAAARVALFSGRAAEARERLAHAVGLRPGVADWLPVQGLLAVTAALLDGTAPTSAQAPPAVTWSHRALGEFALDLGVAHLAVGHAEDAAELQMIGLERCSWPYRGRAQARADLVESVVAAGHARDGIPARVRQLIGPPVAPDERADADAAAAHDRMHALLGGSDSLVAGLDGWLPVSQRPVSTWQRLRSLVAYGRHSLAHGHRAASDLVLREARTLARLAGAPGWRAGADAGVGGGGGAGEVGGVEGGGSAGLGAAGRPGRRLVWERLGDDEREFVRLALGGATNAQIADAAYLSVRSVANRMRAIYTLLGIRDRRDLVDQARTDPPGWLADPV